MMGIGTLGRRFCARCNKGIYTTWRTVDEKRYFHPQCFTCADCGIILESGTKYEKPTATQNEIYCGRCHNDRFLVSVYKKTDSRVNADGGKGRIKTPIVGHKPTSSSDPSSKRASPEQNNVSILYSTSPNSKDSLEDNYSQILDPPSRGTTGNQKKKMKAKKSELTVMEKTKVNRKTKGSESLAPEQSTSTLGAENDPLDYLRSRIPRPTSAQSKKSLNTATSYTAPLSAKSKTSQNKLEKGKTNSLRQIASPQRNSTTATSKMQRSLSLVQTQTRNTEGSSAATNKLNRNTSRPRSAGARDENLVTTSVDSQSKTAVSKRQCAASFPTKRKKEGKSSTKARKSNDDLSTLTPLPIDVYSQIKGGLPSTQAILSAIRKEGAVKLKSSTSSGIPLASSESYDILTKEGSVTNTGFCNPYVPSLPKRSFNMTFECPICISSLVPNGNNTNERGGPDTSKGMCRNVVTPCGHIYHKNCIFNWLDIKGNKRCPICSALCLPETLQPVFLECNLCADLSPNPKSLLVPISSKEMFSPNDYNGIHEMITASYRTLRSEYELLHAKYNALLTENHNFSLNSTLTNSLQNAYDMECRNRLQLQWENRKLQMKIEELQNL